MEKPPSPEEYQFNFTPVEGVEDQVELKRRLGQYFEHLKQTKNGAQAQKNYETQVAYLRHSGRNEFSEIDFVSLLERLSFRPHIFFEYNPDEFDQNFVDDLERLIERGGYG